MSYLVCAYVHVCVVCVMMGRFGGRTSIKKVADNHSTLSKYVTICLLKVRVTVTDSLNTVVLNQDVS